jgi:hypothetical protein
MSVPGQFDLILISDSGKQYLIKMKETPDGHEPESVEPLDPSLSEVPNLLRESGATLAIMPDAPSAQGGCTCVLLNMQNIKNAIRPSVDPSFEAMAKVRRALRAGATLSIKSGDKEEEIRVK